MTSHFTPGGATGRSEPVDTCKDVMLDIETLSIHPSNALVVSMAAIGFTIEAAEPVWGSRITRVFDVREQIMLGREVDTETQKFWMSQTPAAAHHWLHGEPTELGRALNEIAEFLAPYERVWASGIVFDIGNMETLYRSTRIAVPWKYNATRDARTIYKEFTPKTRLRPETVRIDNLHEPAADCENQIWGLWEHWPGLSVQPQAPVPAATGEIFSH